MNQKKKGLHYVPNKSHLANFADTSGKVWVLNEAGKIFSTNPTNVFKESDFYTVKLKGGGGTLVVEDALANIEGTFTSIYRDKIVNELGLTPEEKARAAVFLGALYLRTRSNREGLRGMLQQLDTQIEKWRKIFENNPKAREFSALHSGGEGARIYPEDVKEALENADEFHSLTMMDSLPEVAQMIFDMNWCILTAPTGQVFITSDDPFQIVRPESLKKYGPRAIGSVPGLGWADAEITVPLSSTHAILGGWKLEHNSFLPAGQRLFDQINLRTSMYAKEIVANNQDTLRAVKDKALARKQALAAKKIVR